MAERRFCFSKSPKGAELDAKHKTDSMLQSFILGEI